MLLVSLNIVLSIISNNIMITLIYNKLDNTINKNLVYSTKKNKTKKKKGNQIEIKSFRDNRYIIMGGKAIYKSII